MRLETRPPNIEGKGTVTQRDLVRNALRMRPDRIIVGEVRAGEALDLIQSMISGHAGSLSTIHANTARDALVRLETLSLMSDIEIPIYVARAQVASAIHLIVEIARFTEDGSRKVTRIAEALGLDEANRYATRDLFVSRLRGKAPDGRLIAELEPTGERPAFCREPYEQGMEDRIELTKPLWGD